MAIEKKRVQEQLEALGDYHHFFTAREIRHLPAILSEHETIQGLTSGYYESKTWIIVITDARLIFLDAGMFYGLKQTDMPLSQICAISHKTTLFYGEIEVATNAGSKKIGTIPKKDVVKIASLLSQLVHGYAKPRPLPSSTPTIVPPTTTLKTDLASQLERLTVLYEKGVLSEDEFTLSKSRLLAPEL